MRTCIGCPAGHLLRIVLNLDNVFVLESEIVAVFTSSPMFAVVQEIEVGAWRRFLYERGK